MKQGKVAQLLGEEKGSTRRGSRSSLANSEHEQHDEVSCVGYKREKKKIYIYFSCTACCSTRLVRLLSFSSFFLFFFRYPARYDELATQHTITGLAAAGTKGAT